MNPKIKEAFEHQAISCASLGSKFTARVYMAFSENLDTSTKLGQLIDNWPEGNTHLIGRANFHGRWIKWFGL